MQNAANECQIQELMEASRNSLAEKLHGQQSQLRSTKNELEIVMLELAGKKVELENKKLAKPSMNANDVKLKNQRGRLSGFATALDGHEMDVGNERLANCLHWRKLNPIDVPAQWFPEDKVELLKQLKATSLTGMVGDGNNDDPALAALLMVLAVAMRLGQKSRRKILQNIILSVTTKAMVIVLAAVGYASLWGDVLANVGTCLLVIFNSMLFLERKKDESGCLGLFAFRRKRRSKVCQKDVLLSSEKYVNLEAEPWCPKKMEDNRVSTHGTKQKNEYCMSYCATMSCCDVRSANNGMRQRVNNRDVCEKDCQCIAIDEGLLVSSDAADVGSEVRDSLLGGSSEGDVESVRYQELASYAPAHGIVRSQDFSSKEGRHVEVESAPIRHLNKHEDERDMILQYYKFQNCSFNNTYLLVATEENKIKVLGKDFGGWSKTEEADDLVWDDAKDGLETPFFFEKDFKEAFSKMASGENPANFDSFPSSKEGPFKFNMIGNFGRQKVCTDVDQDYSLISKNGERVSLVHLGIMLHMSLDQEEVQVHAVDSSPLSEESEESSAENREALFSNIEVCKSETEAGHGRWLCAS
ncbi:hypothetical protein L7F22_058154 [Adiantum nelumboides]|nr:hypothetical protein [Adiantum nelumboides]